MGKALMSPQDMAQRLGRGLLSFPVTHFDDGFNFAEHDFRSHVNWLLDHGPSALFPAGGTGEFFSLTLEEYEAIVRATAEETSGRVPVVPGCGYGTRTAIQFAQAAERSCADGILLLPPYLVNATQAGIVEHVRQVCAATSLGVIFYNRDNAVLNETDLEQLCETSPNLVGLKDGHGDIELITRIRAHLGDRLVYIGGLPTAETFALPYLEIGVTTYSSAIFNFVPQFALKFYDAVRSHNRDQVFELLRAFVLPYIAIRSRRKGFAVSIVKAGMKAIGRNAGPVRPPLTDLLPAELEELQGLISALKR